MFGKHPLIRVKFCELAFVLLLRSCAEFVQLLRLNVPQLFIAVNHNEIR